MEFFRRYYSNVDFDDKEQVKVHCPFHSDEHASATINTEKSLFYCPVCMKGGNEVKFISEINDIPLIEATKILKKLEDTQTINWGLVEKAELWGDQTFLNKVRELGFNDATIEELDLGLIHGKNNTKFLGIPVYYNNIIVDVRRYNIYKINGVPKVIGNADTETGFIFPYDIWLKDDRKTYIFEGEKDAIIARQFGLNAITLTGGAGAEPNQMTINSFKNKEVVLCYDNDKAGLNGMVKVFSRIHDIVKSVRYIDISEIVEEEKEDFYDAVFKYNLDMITFSLLVENDFDKKLLEAVQKLTPIKLALKDNLIKKRIKTVVNVSAEYSDSYALPVIAEFTKTKMTDSLKGNDLSLGAKKTWYFDRSKSIGQLLELIELRATKEEVIKKLQHFAGVPNGEVGMTSAINAYETVYKYKIIDANVRYLDDDKTHDNTTLDVYSFTKLNVGTEYLIDYAIYPHPTKNQKLVAVSFDVKTLDDEKNYLIDKESLDEFRIKGTVEERVKYLFGSARQHIAKHLNFNMWLMSDLVFNSILNIKYGTKTWGALDVFILGDTAVGKSELTKGLVDLYDFGHFLSLKTSTTIGLIGGSKKEGDSMLNTIGAIPRQHKKLVVMEEFSGADPSFIKTMTDVRTTRRVHIVRVAGELDVACNTRMITISNPIGDEHGLPKYLSTFPNGVMPLMELINNPEDVGRYDGYLLAPQITDRFNPFNVEFDDKQIEKQHYEHKAKWVYTRTEDNVIFEKGVEAYIWEKAEELNRKYESNFPLFGTKASIKLARFSVALASLIVNVDDTYENIIVTKDIVDYIVSFFDTIYDNPIFKLREYKVEYDSFNNYTDKDVKELQNIYPQNSNFVDYLQGVSVTSLETLKANSGLEYKEFNILYSKFSQMKFIRSLGRSIVPTTKFRKVSKLIDKSFTVNAGKIAQQSKTYKIEDDDDGI